MEHGQPLVALYRGLASEAARLLVREVRVDERKIEQTEEKTLIILLKSKEELEGEDWRWSWSCTSTPPIQR